MRRTQWIMVVVLTLAVIIVFCALATMIMDDLSEALSAYLAISNATRTPQPTATWTSIPTFTPTLARGRPSVSTAEEAIQLVRDFNYNSGQTVSDFISTLLAASQQMGHTVDLEGWQAEDQGDDVWIVTMAYMEDNSPVVYEFWADTVSGAVKGHNHRAKDLLDWLRQAAGITPEATPTEVVVPLQTPLRDDLSHWEYVVPTEPSLRPTISAPTKELEADVAFLVFPLQLVNIADGPQQVDSTYYTRFSLLDRDGRPAARLDWEGFGQPTRLWCEANDLPHFALGIESVAPGETTNTALAFNLLPEARAPFTLRITVQEGDVLHIFSIVLGGSIPPPTPTSPVTVIPTPWPTSTPIWLSTPTPSSSTWPYLTSGSAWGQPDCHWTGVFGDIKQANGSPAGGVQVKAWSEDGQGPFLAPSHPDGTYSLHLSGHPVAGVWHVHLVENDQPASPTFIFQTTDDCQTGLQKVWISWQRTR